MRRNITFLIIILLLPVFIVGCGQDSGGTAGTDQTAQHETVENQTGKDKKEQLQNATEKAEEKSQQETTEESEKNIYNPLTGEMVSKVQNLTAVMVNNHGKARPQTGLIDADIVYELEMEGLITRFFALFYGDPPKHVGPVRSARPYTLALAKEWDAYFVHVGGSDEAFALVEKWGIRDIDDTHGHPGFWLDETRKRPHNTYINLERALRGKDGNGKFKEWNFVDGYDNVPDYKEIKLKYSKYNRIKYAWDNQEKKYERYINGYKHIDRISGRQITAKNIIIQYAKHTYSGDKEKHIEIDIIGKGKAEYFLGGKYFEGTWEKKSLAAPTRFYDKDGNHIKPVKGNTWIQVVRKDAEIEKVK